MHDLQYHAAKLASAKLKLGSVVDLMLAKKQRKKQDHACDVDWDISNHMQAP